MRLVHILILSALLFISVPLSVTADNQSEAVVEGAASALGNAMRDIGLDISGGSLPAVEHIFSNWKNLQNPCGNARKLIMAFLQDSNPQNGQPGGTAFADVMVNVFDLPRSSAATLAVQGEIVSKRLWGKYRLRKRLRDVLFEIHRLCNPPKKPATSVATGGGAATSTTGVSAGGDVNVQPPPTPKPKPKPKPKPAKVWTADDPCPECAEEAKIVEYFKQRIKDMQARLKAVQKDLAENAARQKQISTEQAELDAELKSQEGTFAEGYDPATGIRIRSENVGGGKVRITTTYPDGRTETRTRNTHSSKRIKKRKQVLDKELSELTAKETKLKENEATINKVLKKAESDLEAAKKTLDKCIKEKCNKGQAPETALLLPGGGGEPVSPPAAGCKPTLTSKPIAIGSKAEIGGGVSKMIRDKAKSLIGGALGGLLGGGGSGISFGGGGELGDASDSGPDLFSDPINNKQTFTVPNSDIKVRVGAKFDTDGKFLVSSEIIEASGKPTFHDVTLHNIGCGQARPIKLYPYGIYTEWSLEMKTIYYRCDDGGCVKTGETDWQTIDSGKIAEYGLFTAGDGKGKFPGIWSQFYDSAEGGINSLGAKFNLDYKSFSDPFVLSLKYTQPDNDPVTAVSLNLVTHAKENGEVEFAPLYDFYKYRPSKDGGMTKIDPPDPKLLKKIEAEAVDSVVDELAPYGSGSDSANKVESVIDELSPDGYGGGSASPGLSIGSDSAIKLQPRLEYYNPDKDLSISIPYDTSIREIDVDATRKAFDEWYQHDSQNISGFKPGILDFGNTVSLWDPVARKFVTFNVDDLTDEQWDILEDEMW